MAERNDVTRQDILSEMAKELLPAIQSGELGLTCVAARGPGYRPATDGDAHTILPWAKVCGDLPICGGVGDLLYAVASAERPICTPHAGFAGRAGSADRCIHPQRMG